MILDVVVGAAREAFGDFSPLVAVLLVCFEHGLLLAVAPHVLVDFGIELVVPAV